MLCESCVWVCARAGGEGRGCLLGMRRRNPERLDHGQSKSTQTRLSFNMQPPPLITNYTNMIPIRSLSAIGLITKNLHYIMPSNFKALKFGSRII